MWYPIFDHITCEAFRGGRKKIMSLTKISFFFMSSGCSGLTSLWAAFSWAKSLLILQFIPEVYRHIQNPIHSYDLHWRYNYTLYALRQKKKKTFIRKSKRDLEKRILPLSTQLTLTLWENASTTEAKALSVAATEGKLTLSSSLLTA